MLIFAALPKKNKKMQIEYYNTTEMPKPLKNYGTFLEFALCITRQDVNLWSCVRMTVQKPFTIEKIKQAAVDCVTDADDSDACRFIQDRLKQDAIIIALTNPI